MANAGDLEISVLTCLRSLRWIAPLSLVTFLGLWAFTRPPGISMPAVVAFWALFTLAIGPLVWVRLLPNDAPGRWQALGLACFGSSACCCCKGSGTRS
jgi:hypothetical protein